MYIATFLSLVILSIAVGETVGDVTVPVPGLFSCTVPDCTASNPILKCTGSFGQSSDKYTFNGKCTGAANKLCNPDITGIPAPSDVTQCTCAGTTCDVNFDFQTNGNFKCTGIWTCPIG